MRQRTGGDEVHAGLGKRRDARERDIAAGLQTRLVSCELDGLQDLFVVHVVEQDVFRSGKQGLVEFVKGIDLDLDLELRIHFAGAADGPQDAALPLHPGEFAVIVLDHDAVVQADAVIVYNGRFKVINALKNHLEALTRQAQEDMIDVQSLISRRDVCMTTGSSLVKSTGGSQNNTASIL